MNKNILITGARAPIALDLARQFAKEGHRVFLADSCRSPISKVSNVIQAYLLLPQPKTNPRAYIQAINQIAQDKQIDLIIPTCEEIFYLSRFKDQISPNSQLFCDEFTKLTCLHNKWRFIEQITDYVVKAPQTILLTSNSDLKKISHFEQYVLKPVFSRFAAKTLISPDQTQLANIKITDGYPWVAQQRIFGTEYSCYGIALDGKLTGLSIYTSAYRAGKGAGIYFESVKHEKILDFVKSFVKNQHFHGQISFDFMEDSKDCYVLECNPRATSGLHLLSQQPNFCQCFWGSGQWVETSQDTPKKMVGFAMLLYALPQSLSIAKTKKLLQDLSMATDVIYDKRDKKPAFYQFYSLMDLLFTSLFQRKPLLEISTGDIEYNGQSL